MKKSDKDLTLIIKNVITIIFTKIIGKWKGANKMTTNKIIELHKYREIKKTPEDIEKKKLRDAQKQLDQIITTSVESAFTANEPIFDQILETLLNAIQELRQETNVEEKACLKKMLAQAMKKTSTLTMVSFINALPAIFPHLFPK